MRNPHGGDSGVAAVDAKEGCLHIELLGRRGLFRQLHVIRTLDGNSVGTTVEGAVSWSRQYLRNDVSLECAEVFSRESDAWQYRGSVVRQREAIVWQSAPTTAPRGR